MPRQFRRTHRLGRRRRHGGTLRDHLRYGRDAAMVKEPQLASTSPTAVLSPIARTGITHKAIFGRTSARHALTLSSAVLLGCTAPVAASLEESDANRIVVALDRARVDATKEIDPAMEGRYRVIVSRDETAHALTVLRDEELPRPHAAGVLDAVGKGALVPSDVAEHAQMVAGIAGDLERTFQSIDGVLTARVHLSVPPPTTEEMFGEAPPAPRAARRPTASVLLEYRGGTPPLTESEIQRVVAGGVANLAPENVATVLLARPAPSLTAESTLAHVGPIAVARGSMHALQLVLAGLIVLVAGLAAATLALYIVMTRFRAELNDRESARNA